MMNPTAARWALVLGMSGAIGHWAAAGDEAVCPPAQPEPTIAIDAVAATDGREVAGAPEISAVHGGYRYLFESPENAALFLKNPGRYEVMWDGACGRMGPLSGRGHPTLHAVHEGRVFLFASGACRQTFLEDPARCIDTDDPVPVGSAESVARARSLLDQAERAMGTAERIEALVSWREHRSDMAEDDPTREDTETLTLLLPDGAHLRQSWGPHAYERMVRGDGGVFRDSSGEKVMHEAQVAAMRREMAHHPLVIMRSRDRADFVAVMAEPGEAAGVKVERVTVHFDGAATTLSIDPQSGRVVATEYRDRGKRSLIGSMRREYSDFREVGGVTTAFTSKYIWEGVLLEKRGATLDVVEPDAAVDPGLFGPSSG